MSDLCKVSRTGRINPRDWLSVRSAIFETLKADYKEATGSETITQAHARYLHTQAGRLAYVAIKALSIKVHGDPGACKCCALPSYSADNKE